MDSNLIEADQSRFKFSTLLKPILQDIQTRLVFRAQSIIQAEVANYQPKNEDLDYPNKLIQAEKRRQKDGLKSKRSQNSTTFVDHRHTPLKSRLPAQDVQETWYPTLRKTLWVLSRLHTYVNVCIPSLFFFLSLFPKCRMSIQFITENTPNVYRMPFLRISPVKP